MKTILTVAMFSLGTVMMTTASAEPIQLADGTVIEGALGAPAEITVKTATGEKRIPFSMLPADVQGRYWRKAAEQSALAAAASHTAASSATVADEELAALANEVNLATWEQVTAIGSFRDKPEKRGTGGLVVTKAFNAIEENWVSVYSPKDGVGLAGNWDAQVARAKTLAERAPQFLQKRWLALFVRAGEAVAHRDSDAFAAAVREMKRNPLNPAVAVASENSRDFFPAK
jgi:hypothetical protein